MGKSIRLDSLKRIVENSYQDKIERAIDCVTGNFGETAQLFSLYEDHVVVLYADGSFHKFQYDGLTIGEELELNLEMLDEIDEAIVLIEQSRRLVERLIVGDLDSFRKGLTELFPIIQSYHAEASELISNRIGTLMSEAEFVRIHEEKNVPMRKALYGTLSGLRDRAIKARFQKYYESSDETIRDNVIVALHNIMLRLEGVIDGIKDIQVDDVKLPDDILMTRQEFVNMFNGVTSFSKDVVKTVSQKLKLDSTVCETSELCKLHDGIAGHVNAADFCGEFIKRIANNS